jgi:hypothetical protein
MTITNFKNVKVNGRDLFKQSPTCLTPGIEAEESHEERL